MGDEDDDCGDGETPQSMPAPSAPSPPPKPPGERGTRTFSIGVGVRDVEVNLDSFDHCVCGGWGICGKLGVDGEDEDKGWGEVGRRKERKRGSGVGKSGVTKSFLGFQRILAEQQQPQRRRHSSTVTAPARSSLHCLSMRADRPRPLPVDPCVAASLAESTHVDNRLSSSAPASDAEV